jgi:hypothetical protein
MIKQPLFILILTTCLLLASCGSDRSDYFGYQSKVAGQYVVFMEPMINECNMTIGVRTTYTMNVSQFDGELVIALDESGGGGYPIGGISLYYEPARGALFQDGSFSLATSGWYRDDYTWTEGNMSWYLSGYITSNRIEGTSETFMFDPWYGGECLISHTFQGSRVR